MASPRRNQVCRSWSCGANGKRWGDDGWPESQAKRSASVHGAIRGFGERPGGVVVCRNRPDEGDEGREVSGGTHGEFKAAEVAVAVASEGDWSDDRDGKGGSWYKLIQADARHHGGFARREPQGPRR